MARSIACESMVPVARCSVSREIFAIFAPIFFFLPPLFSDMYDGVSRRYCNQAPVDASEDLHVCNAAT